MRSVMLALATFLFTWSATAAGYEKIALAKGSKIGIISNLASEVTNSGVGFTAFSKYSIRLANDWQLDKFSEVTTKKLLEKAGYRPVDLKIGATERADLFAGADLSRMNFDGLSRKWKAKYRDLMDKSGVAAIVVLRENQLPLADLRDERVGRGYIVSSSFGFLKAVELIVTVTADAIGGPAPHRAIDVCLAREKFDPRILPVDKLSDASIAELAPLRNIFEYLLEKKIMFDLTSSGLLNEMKYCPSWFPEKNTDPALKKAR